MKPCYTYTMEYSATNNIAIVEFTGKVMEIGNNCMRIPKHRKKNIVSFIFCVDVTFGAFNVVIWINTEVR